MTRCVATTRSRWGLVPLSQLLLARPTDSSALPGFFWVGMIQKCELAGEQVTNLFDNFNATLFPRKQRGSPGLAPLQNGGGIR